MLNAPILARLVRAHASLGVYVRGGGGLGLTNGVSSQAPAVATARPPGSQWADFGAEHPGMQGGSGV